MSEQHDWHTYEGLYQLYIEAQSELFHLRGGVGPIVAENHRLKGQVKLLEDVVTAMDTWIRHWRERAERNEQVEVK